MDFEIKKFDAGGRLGLIKHNDKKLITPNLFPVVSPFRNLIPPQEIIDNFGGGAVFTNAYILFNNKELMLKAQDVGIHEFIDFNGLIATDSGAFQHYMYGNEGDLTAESIETFQEKIGSDFPVILDLPVQLDDSKEIASDKVEKTIIRAKENISRRQEDNCAWFGPIHGARNLDLVKRSAIEMSKLNFGIYAIGGVVKTFNDYMFDISMNAILTAKRYLKPEIPLHLFGAGLPQYFALSVACGADTMDSAAYILFAKEGRYMTLEGTKQIEDLIELPCNCPICSKYSAKELKELYKKSKLKGADKDKTGVELIARHNLYVSFAELKTIREAIRTGTLWDLVEQRIHAHPRLIKAYKELPKYWPQLEISEAREKTKATLILGDISSARPTFHRIAKDIYHNYVIPDKTNLVLLPELDSSVYNSPSLSDWTRKIQEYNIDMYKSNELDKIFDIILISNQIGPIPYVLNDIYPLCQREWSFQYKRSNQEMTSFVNYFLNKMNPGKNSEIAENTLNSLRNAINRNKSIQKRKFRDNLLKVKNLVDFGEFSIENTPLTNEDLFNRIELSMQFFKKNKEKINQITILCPETFITDEGFNSKTEDHLIHDLSALLTIPSNSKPETKIKIIKKIEDLWEEL